MDFILTDQTKSFKNKTVIETNIFDIVQPKNLSLELILKQ